MLSSSCLPKLICQATNDILIRLKIKTICSRKKLPWLERKVKQFAWQKGFANSYEDLVFIICIFIMFFFIINSNKQELIYHIHCFEYIFYHQSMTKNLVDFISSCSMIFTLNPMHWTSQTFHIQQNIFIFIMTYFCLHLLFFYAHCYHLPNTNTSLALIQQILQSEHQLIRVSFTNH